MSKGYTASMGGIAGARTGSGRAISDTLVVVRGGGDIATGVVSRLHRVGFPVVVTELERPLTVRRTVSLSTAVHGGSMQVEQLVARRADNVEKARAVLAAGEVAVMVSPGLPPVHADVVIDARLAKRNIDTSLTDAAFVVGLGPGFTAAKDCDAVIETNRGHRLGRALWTGSAERNTGVPGEIGGKSQQRVLRAPRAGTVQWLVDIGDLVQVGQAMGIMDNSVINSPFTGIVRGLIHPATSVKEGVKIGDVDPRVSELQRADVHTISDKALAIGGGALEAVLTWINGKYARI